MDSRPLTIPAALDDAARRFGRLTAYVQTARGARLSPTWAEVRDDARETAAGLIALGLEQGERVALCAENSIDWIVSYLATVTAGGAGVLVYSELKPAEILRQVAWAGCRFLVTSPTVLSKLPDSLPGVEVVVALGAEDAGTAGALSLQAVRAAADDAARAALATRSAAPDDLAAIIYTSGTTGGAKGVMLSHGNFLSNAASVCEVFDFSPRDSVLLVLPLHHALPFLAAVVLPLLVGASFIIENDLARIRDRLREHRPTIFFGVPALYELMYRNVLARAEAEGRLQALLAWQKRVRRVKQATGLNIGPLVFRSLHRVLGGRLRFLVSGGAALKPDTARDFFSLGLPLLQGWGMTEAAPAIAVQPFSRRRFLTTRYYERRAGSVGRPVPGVEVRLIDVPDKDIRVAEGGQGEVIVRGPNLFQGYWQSEDATSEARLDGWLRTGDLGRIDANGDIWLTGRSKYIIVLDSGEKVYPDEVEDKLRESDLLQDICIVSRPSSDGRERTLVTVVVYPGLEASRALGIAGDVVALQQGVGAEVERLCRELAAYKRVTRVELSDSPLPKTPLLKVARGQIAAAYEFDFDRWLASENPD